MATYIMYGTYSGDSFDGMGSQRTQSVVEKIKTFGGEVHGMYALLGQDDLLFIVEFPSTAAAMKASVSIQKATGTSFTTSPAVTVEEFDNLVADL